MNAFSPKTTPDLACSVCACQAAFVCSHICSDPAVAGAAGSAPPSAPAAVEGPPAHAADARSNPATTVLTTTVEGRFGCTSTCTSKAFISDFRTRTPTRTLKSLLRTRMKRQRRMCPVCVRRTGRLDRCGSTWRRNRAMKSTRKWARERAGNRRKKAQTEHATPDPPDPVRSASRGEVGWARCGLEPHSSRMSPFLVAAQPP